MPTDNKRPRCKNPDCRRQFTRPQGTNRLYCFECRPERTNVVNAPFGAKNGENSGENGEDEGKLARFSRIQLEKWGVFDTWQGAAAMALAALIDEGKGGGSGGAASAVKAHREAMQVAYEVAEVDEADIVEAIFGKGN